MIGERNPDLYHEVRVSFERLFCSLNDAAQAISDLMTNQNIARLEAGIADFKALTPEMKKANDALTKLKGQIASIASGIANVAKVEGAINQVLGIALKFL